MSEPALTISLDGWALLGLFIVFIVWQIGKVMNQ